MSEDDRAAKAARAKALLAKKRQQKKAGNHPAADSTTSSRPSSPAVESARTFSPAPSQVHQEEEKKNLGDVFASHPTDGRDSGWLSSLPRVDSPSAPPVASRLPVTSPPPSIRAQIAPKPVQPPVPIQTSSNHLEELAELESHIQSQQQTISLLVSEKATLSASLEHLRDVEAKLHEAESMLRDESTKSSGLQDRTKQLESDGVAASRQINELKIREKDLSDRCRDQERELQLLRGTANDLRAEVESRQNTIRELTEQIQNDDTVERLEVSLKNTQNRADELEFQLSKVKQTHDALKAERDSLEVELQLHDEAQTESKKQIAGLMERQVTLENQLSYISTERDAALKTKATLQGEVDYGRKTISDLEQKLTQAASEIGSLTRQLQSVQTELRGTRRRAEEAERIQMDLQSEGSNLMRSLEEMRPKLVELTNEKLELSERIEGLEKEIRSRDSTIEELEVSLEQLRQQRGETDEQMKQLQAALLKEHSSRQDALSELQGAYANLQADLDKIRQELESVQSMNVALLHTEAEQKDEIARLSASSRGREAQLLSLQEELEERTEAQAEEEEFLERARSELETVRREMTAKDEEIEQLRVAAASVPSPSTKSVSLDEEMLSALKQQHALDLSNAYSRIRGLENDAFEAEAKVHSLQKQVRVLEDQLLQHRPSSQASHRPFSPPGPSGPGSRATKQGNDIRRASFNTTRPTLPTRTSSRSLLDQTLSPETQHKRKVSLHMLKARIESEMSASQSTSKPSSRALSPVSSMRRDASGLPTVLEPAVKHQLSFDRHAHRRPQFLDESHIFWCHCCRGDLVIL
ncbi:hypothetical protein NEOLEDRAFT_1176590 [Neolentinus lepideus HHB14362 ss-1]|uniref:Uncharacterized protein n=1 Tax=Neolentinus lepideus HHB14362 ss-1 TaxID=1314782 RepID=A0A165U329_9AGAM|nr:hypothetical protein NEOLEDRAFT_1176590 [Neolentinus lepideus HHB14362 ss-1]